MNISRVARTPKKMQDPGQKATSHSAYMERPTRWPVREIGDKVEFGV